MHKLMLAALAATVFTTSSAFAACDTINSTTIKLSACVEEGAWVAQPVEGGAQEFLYFSPDQRVAFTIITEKETFTPADFRGAVLINGKNASGGQDPKVTSERVENVLEKPWNVIEYLVGAAGEELQFQNFYYSQPGFGSVQVVFWSVPSDATIAAYHAGRLLSSVSYGN
jgi:hypothetical protein